MDDAARADFLAQFLPDAVGVTLGLAVMGGVFAEGIDLPAERLCGAVVVGVGLPQVCLERDVLREAYEETYQSGFRYAYQYPGMSKVLQAAGRIIRTETDRGALLLIDTRYSLADYRGLLPPHWKIERVKSVGELSFALSQFWNDAPSIASQPPESIPAHLILARPDRLHKRKKLWSQLQSVCLIRRVPDRFRAVLILSSSRGVRYGGGHHGRRYLRQSGVARFPLIDLFDLPDWEHTLRTWSEYYAPLAVENKPFAGIEPLLAAIRRAGLPLGVATSQGRELYQEHFHKYGLAHYFDIAVCADDVANPKPAADPLLLPRSILPSLKVISDSRRARMTCRRKSRRRKRRAAMWAHDPTFPRILSPTPLDVLSI
jgi:hypothetical protein